MPNYPDSIYEPREKEQRSGVEYVPEKKSVIFVEDVKKLDEEVVAIETDLIAQRNAVCEVSFGRGEGGDNNFTIAKDTWTKVYFPDIPYYSIYDPGGNYDEVNDYYVCPVAGIYEVITRMRIRDNPTGGIQWVQGTQTLTGATALIQLTIANVRQAAISNIRISHFNAGDHIPMYVLSWGFNLIASDGYQVVKLLYPD